MSLLSPEFLGVALAACCVCWLLPPAPRLVGFVALGIYYAGTHLGPTGLAAMALFVLLGWGALRLAEQGRGGVLLAVIALVTVFLWWRNDEILGWVLPSEARNAWIATAGLSFLFFRILHAVLDARGNTLGPRSFGLWLAYCFNFTTFLLGPIQRFQSFREQWEDREGGLPRRFEPHLDAVNRILRGLVKRYVLAEMLAGRALGPGMDLDAMPLWQVGVATYVFYLYLYCDFSGYCDVVIGVGALMGIKPPENFHLPFLAANISEFWLRVHRSLTTWLTDYVFNPLYAAGLRSRWLGARPLPAALLAIMVTMFVSGVWHGPTVNFVIFGVVHGLFLVVFRIWEHLLRQRLGRKGLKALRERWVYRGAAILLTFLCSGGAYIFFRLEIHDLQRLVSRITG